MKLYAALMKNVQTAKGHILVCAERDIEKKTKFAWRKVSVQNK